MWSRILAGVSVSAVDGWMDDCLLDEAETSGFHSWYLISRDVIMCPAKLKKMSVKTPVMQCNTIQCNIVISITTLTFIPR